MKNLEIITACGLGLLLAAGCGNGNGGENDTAADQPVDTPAETVDETPVDVPADGECPPDDATHIYINVAGQVQSLVPGGSVDGLMVEAISPLEALMPGDPTPIGTATTDSDGMFAMDCIDVGTVALGLVILVDDPTGGDDNYFPTGTGVKGWDTADEKVDVLDAAPFAVANTLIAGLETLITTLDVDTNGLAMGLVVNGATHAPVDGAVINTAGGDAAPVSYPNADFSGLETDDNTSANGSFVFNGPVTLSGFTAVATGLTFAEHQAATKAGFCYFMVMAGE